MKMTCLREEVGDWVEMMTSPDQATSYWLVYYWGFSYFLVRLDSVLNTWIST